MVNSPIGVSVLKLSTRRSFHPKCFSTLLDDNCDFLISRGIDGNFTRSRLNGVMSMIRLGYHYVSWVDDDDELIPDIYSELLGVFEKYPDTSIAFSETLILKKDGTYFHKELSDKRNTVIETKDVSVIHQPVVIPSRLFQKYSYVFKRDGITEFSLYREILKNEPQLSIRCLTKPGYIYNKRH